MAGLDIEIQSFDIPRLVSVYPDRALIRWWTKLWINNHEDGEPSVEITREQAIRFLWDNIDKDEWCERYFPEQMKMYHKQLIFKAFDKLRAIVIQRQFRNHKMQ